jgi:hypothetical protein
VTNPTAPNALLSVDNTSEELVRDRELLESNWECLFTQLLRKDVFSDVLLYYDVPHP